jgi:uncharacterized protein (DUF2141 family)
MKHLIFTSFCLFLTHSTFALTIDVTDLNNIKGSVVCYLYTSEEGFPDEPAKAKLKIVSPISAEKKATCVIEVPELQGSEVAVSILHDEDENGEMKLNFIGIPKEGWAASNNAEAQTFGPPKYEDAKFDPRKVTQQTLKMNY